MYKDFNSLMMLGLVNTLQNNGTITKEDRDDILGLGEYTESIASIREAKELIEKLKSLREKEIG